MKVVQFCSGKRCCPNVKLYSETNNIVIEDEHMPEKGSVCMSKDQFRDLVDAAKNGKFNEILNG